LPGAPTYTLNVSDAEEKAAIDALIEFKAVTAQRRRAKIIACPLGEDPVDVTEAVVDVLDMVHSSLNWSSNFYNDTDKLSFIALCRLLKVDPPE
jgi:hypothetical protein